MFSNRENYKADKIEIQMKLMVEQQIYLIQEDLKQIRNVDHYL
jgi:hypothetical protein